MPTESNCLTHNKPHEKYGNCSEWVRVYMSAPLVGEYGMVDLPEDFRQCSWEPDRWHEPQEGIIGSERDDDLLDLTPQALRRRLIMCAMAKGFHRALMVSSPAPISEKLRERYRESYTTGTHNFVPGDLVIEATTLYGGDRAPKWDRGFGVYITDRIEWAYTRAAWEEAVEEDKSYYDDPSDYDIDVNFGPRHTDHAWYIQYGPRPGDVCRWTNCSFVALPMSVDEVARIENEALSVGISSGKA